MADGDRLADRRRRRPRHCTRVGVMRAINRHVERVSLHRESIRIGDAGVPALTGGADIKLNTRLSLRAPTEKIASRTGYSLTHGRKAVGQNIFRPTVLLETGYRSHD
jgi:hypothetical protein